MHQSITFDCYKKKFAKEIQLKNVPARPLRCSEQHGEFDNIQCNSQNCFCVNHLTGIEIANTRMPLSKIEQTRRFPFCYSLLNNNSNYFILIYIILLLFCRFRTISFMSFTSLW